MEVLEILYSFGGLESISGCALDGSTCAYLACEKGHIGVLETILNLTGGGMLNTKEGGWTCFHEAAASGQLEVMKKLVKWAKDREDCGDGIMAAPNGITVLYAAAIRKDVCEVMIKVYYLCCIF